MQAGEVNNLSDAEVRLFYKTISRRPHTIEVNCNNVASVLLEQYASPLSKEILDTSLSTSFTAEAASDYSGLTWEVFSIFFKVNQENYFDGYYEFAPRHVGHCPVPKTFTHCSQQWVNEELWVTSEVTSGV